MKKLEDKQDLEENQNCIFEKILKGERAFCLEQIQRKHGHCLPKFEDYFEQERFSIYSVAPKQAELGSLRKYCVEMDVCLLKACTF